MQVGIRWSGNQNRRAGGKYTTKTSGKYPSQQRPMGNSKQPPYHYHLYTSPYIDKMAKSEWAIPSKYYEKALNLKTTPVVTNLAAGDFK
jgi:hypothetical protein